MGLEFWSLTTGPYPMHLGLFFTLSLLLLILLLIACGNCTRKSAELFPERSYTEAKSDSQLLRISQLEDPNYPKNISKATIKGAPGSRKVSWQNDIHVTGTPERGDFPSQHSRALPEIPNASLSKENSDGKVDPVYQTASELAAGADGQFGEDTIEPPYAASNQFSLETPKTEFIIQDDVGRDEAGCQLGKVAPVYAKVSKKPKQSSSLNRPGPSTCPENVQDEEEPPPIPEKCFSDVSDDVVVSESPNCKTLVDTASGEASRDDWVTADCSINEDRCSVATHNGTTLSKLV